MSAATKFAIDWMRQLRCNEKCVHWPTAKADNIAGNIALFFVSFICTVASADTVPCNKVHVPERCTAPFVNNRLHGTIISSTNGPMVAKIVSEKYTWRVTSGADLTFRRTPSLHLHLLIHINLQPLRNVLFASPDPRCTRANM